MGSASLLEENMYHLVMECMPFGKPDGNKCESGVGLTCDLITWELVSDRILIARFYSRMRNISKV